jgi:hypothetical protein
MPQSAAEEPIHPAIAAGRLANVEQPNVPAEFLSRHQKVRTDVVLFGIADNQQAAVRNGLVNEVRHAE